jgi:hypothetical protein
MNRLVAKSFAQKTTSFKWVAQQTPFCPFLQNRCQPSRTFAKDETPALETLSKKQRRPRPPRPERAPEDIILERSFLSVKELGEQDPSLPRISHNELQQMMKENKDSFILVDLREDADKIGEPKIQGAVDFPSKLVPVINY